MVQTGNNAGFLMPRNDCFDSRKITIIEKLTLFEQFMKVVAKRLKTDSIEFFSYCPFMHTAISVMCLRTSVDHNLDYDFR